jgi:hypothetical protein
MTTQVIDYDGIDEFVSKNRNMYFEGWDVIVLRPSHAGWMRRDGVQRDGTWYVKKTVSPNSKGKWVFSK